MVDNRSAGFFGIGGSFNFKSGDISGTAAKMQDDKMGQGGEYFAQHKRDDESEKQNEEKYMDRSAILRATLNSLAMMNVANVINARKQALNSDEKKQLDELKRNLEQQHKQEQEKEKEKEKEQNDNKQSTPETLKEEDLIEEQIEKEYNDFINFDIDR